MRAETASEAVLAGEGATERADVRRRVAAFCTGWDVICADRTILYPLPTVIAEEFSLTGWIEDISGSLAGGFYAAAVLPLVGLVLFLGPADRAAEARS